MPPLMNNHGCFIVSLGDVCRWLAAKAEALGVDIFPGFAAVETLHDEAGAVVGVATGDMGVARDGDAQAVVPARHGTPRQVHADRGRRARLARQEADRPLRARRRARAAEVRHRLQGALAGRRRRITGRGSSSTPSAGRSTTAPAAARSSTTTATTWCPSASSSTSTTRTRTCRRSRSSSGSSATRPSARCWTGASASPTARAPSRRAAGSRCRSSPFPAVRLLGCAAGFINVPRIKGSHNAILSGMHGGRCGRRSARRRPRPRHPRRLRGRLADVRHRPRPQAGAQRQAAVVEVRDRRGDRRRRPRHVDQHARLLAVRHARPRRAGPRRDDAGGEGAADRVRQAGRGDDVRPAVVGVRFQHQPRGGPAGPSPRADMALQKSSEHDVYRRAVDALLPGRGLRVARGRRGCATRSTPPTASTARPATSRTPTRTSTGCRRRAAAGRTTATCDGSGPAGRRRDQQHRGERREHGAGEERGVRSDHLPQRAGEGARGEEHDAGDEVEHAEGGAAAVGRRGVGDEGGEQALAQARWTPHRPMPRKTPTRPGPSASMRSAAISTTSPTSSRRRRPTRSESAPAG